MGFHLKSVERHMERIFIWCLHALHNHIYQNQATICLAHIFSCKTSSQVQWIESNWIQLIPIESKWIQLNQIESYLIKLNKIQLNPIFDTRLMILDWNPIFSLVVYNFSQVKDLVNLPILLNLISDRLLNTLIHLK